MYAEMEAKRQRIDDALGRIQNDMWVNVAGMGEGKIVVIFAYSVDVRVRLATGELIDTIAFGLTPLEDVHADKKASRRNEQGRAYQRTFVGTSTTR